MHETLIVVGWRWEFLSFIFSITTLQLSLQTLYKWPFGYYL